MIPVPAPAVMQSPPSGGEALGPVGPAPAARLVRERGPFLQSTSINDTRMGESHGRK